MNEYYDLEQFKEFKKQFPVVKKLSDERIVEFCFDELNKKDNNIFIGELCDEYFATELNKEEIKELANFLIQFADIFLR